MKNISFSFFCVSAIRKNKWWWSIFTYLIDVSIQNAWLLQRKAGVTSLKQHKFRNLIAHHYCTTLADVSKIENARKKMKLNDDTRFDGVAHYVAPCQRRRCAYEFCKSQTRSSCKKCDVGLCVPCFEKYYLLA